MTPQEYLNKIEDKDKKEAFTKLYQYINQYIQADLQEGIWYGMIGWSVPHSIYPQGYHCDATIPLPYISIAAQKNFIGFYHMGLYLDKNLYTWFIENYQKTIKTKVDAGKSCIRFKKYHEIPYELIQELLLKQTVEEWIMLYEKNIITTSKKNKKS